MMLTASNLHARAGFRVFRVLEVCVVSLLQAPTLLIPSALMTSPGTAASPWRAACDKCKPASSVPWQQGLGISWDTPERTQLCNA